MANASEVAVRCPQCGKFLAGLAPEDTGVRVACHGLSIRVERSSALKVVAGYGVEHLADATLGTNVETHVTDAPA